MDFTTFFLIPFKTLGLFCLSPLFYTLVPSAITICVAEVITQIHSTLTALLTHSHILTPFNFAFFRPLHLINPLYDHTTGPEVRSDPHHVSQPPPILPPRVTLHKGTLVGYEIKASSYIIYICHLPPMPLLPRLSP